MNRLYFFLLLAFGSLFFSQCSKPEGCKDTKAINYDPNAELHNSQCTYPTLAVHFSLVVGNLPFEINRIYTIDGYNTAFKQFQFYVSQIELERPDQSIATYPTLFPLVKESKTNFILGEAYAETFEKVRFNIGIDPISNSKIATFLNDPAHDLYRQHPDTMHLDLSNGYIFLKMVGKVDRNGDGIPNENEAFDLRIGTNQMLRAIELTVDKTLTKANESIDIEVDILQLLNNVDLQTEQQTNSINDVPLATKIADNIVGAIRAK